MDRSIPMVAITGNVGSSLLGKDSFQEVYTMGITMPITKHNYTVQRAADIASTLREAFKIAQSGRKGPVLVDITKDATILEADYVAGQPFHEDPHRFRRGDLGDSELHWPQPPPVVCFGGRVLRPKPRSRCTNCATACRYRRCTPDQRRAGLAG